MANWMIMEYGNMEDMSISTKPRLRFCSASRSDLVLNCLTSFSTSCTLWRCLMCEGVQTCHPTGVSLDPPETVTVARCCKDKQTISVSVGSKKGTRNSQMSKAFTWCHTLVFSANSQSQNHTPCYSLSSSMYLCTSMICSLDATTASAQIWSRKLAFVYTEVFVASS